MLNSLQCNKPTKEQDREKKRDTTDRIIGKEKIVKFKTTCSFPQDSDPKKAARI